MPGADVYLTFNGGGLEQSLTRHLPIPLILIVQPVWQV
jgi:hypothetical protein